jgi:hypothetical protein
MGIKASRRLLPSSVHLLYILQIHRLSVFLVPEQRRSKGDTFLCSAEIRKLVFIHWTRIGRYGGSLGRLNFRSYDCCNIVGGLAIGVRGYSRYAVIVSLGGGLDQGFSLCKYVLDIFCDAGRRLLVVAFGLCLPLSLLLAHRTGFGIFFRQHADRASKELRVRCQGGGPGPRTKGGKISEEYFFASSLIALVTQPWPQRRLRRPRWSSMPPS